MGLRCAERDLDEDVHDGLCDLFARDPVQVALTQDQDVIQTFEERCCTIAVDTARPFTSFWNGLFLYPDCMVGLRVMSCVLGLRPSLPVELWRINVIQEGQYARVELMAPNQSRGISLHR